MRVPLSWLKDFVDLPPDLNPEVLAERLTTAGLEVSEVIYLGLPRVLPPNIQKPPAEHLVWDDEKIVLGFIHEVRPHPDADRLVLAMVDHGMGAIETIVTGAPNLYPYKGQALTPPIPVPIAREGAEVYDGHSEVAGKRMILKEKTIRGIPNRHMVCSELELGLSEEHEGVLLLDPADYGQVAPGTPLSQVLGDVVLNIELTPNLARCFSILGVAREVAALFDLALKEPSDALPPMESTESPAYAQILIQHPELNPRFTAALIQNVQVRPSPQWMQRRLKLIGQRPINNLVDVTNYVMFELGQPTHAFDYDILRARAGGQTPTLITRLPEVGEHLTTLDGTDHALQAHNLLVADTAGALSLAGVMGGLESEVQDGTGAHPATRNLLLEAAAWNLINIRQTIASTKLHSEAGARFSRGVHPAMAMRGLVRGLQLLLEVSGGQWTGEILDVYPNPPETIVVELPTSEVERILGFFIPQEEIAAILRRLGFTLVEEGEVLTVTVPDHRLDISRGVIGQAELIEEIARVYGYENIPSTQIRDAMPPQRSNPLFEAEERARDVLVEAGLREVITYRLTTPESEARLTPADMASDWPKADYVRLANPISADKTVMRQTLLTGLLEVAERNRYHHTAQALFEIGNVYYAREKGLPDEPARLALLLTGERAALTWAESQQTPPLYDFYDLKGVVEALLMGLHLPMERLRIVPATHSTFRPGRTAALYDGERHLGVFGEIHPLVVQAFGMEINLSLPLLGAEFDLEALLRLAQASHIVKPIPTQPAVYQDLSIVLDRAIPNAEVEAAIWRAGQELLVGVRLFDVYTGEPIPADKKSMTYALTYQHPSETLTDKQVAKTHKAIVSALEHTLKAQLRG